MIGRSLTMLAGGGVIGATISVWTTGLLAPLLYGVGPRDVATFAFAAAVLTAVALLATWVPARRAARLDPAILLRDA